MKYLHNYPTKHQKNNQMRKIFKIARLELSILFYSPVAWLVLTIFMIQCGITFLDNLQGTRTTLSLGYQTMPITRTLFAGTSGLFTIMQGYIYLYLPILTMGLMSRETSSGSIKLLLSSPVKLRQIILGKYVAIVGYGLALIGVLMIFAVIGGLFIEHVDLGLIFSGLFGLYLLICTYAAIGLFMSCLTTYQVVAAISTLAVFAVLRYVGTLWQEYDFVRDLTYFLSISGRTEKIISGLITTKDVFYYLIIIASFLSLCVLRLKTERELKPWTVKAGRYVALAVVALALGYITSRPVLTGYLDTTDLKSLTISKTSQKITKKVDGELKVTTYINMLAPHLWYVLPQSRNMDLGRLEQFQRFIPGMDINYVYYYQKPIDTNYHEFKYNPNLAGVTNIDKIAEKMATTMGVDGDKFISPAEINKQIDLKPEGYLLLRKLEYKGKSTYLRFYMNDNDPYAAEAEVDAALKRLMVTSPKVIFITGNNERGTDSRVDRDYQMISALKTRRFALVNQGLDVDTVNLNKQDIPSNTDIVVIGDPTVPFTPAQIQKITTYINKGGDMLITGEPGRQHILNPLLQQLGVQLKGGILVKPDKNVTPGFISAQLNIKSVGIDSNLARIQKNGLFVSVQGAAAVDQLPSGPFNVTPLLMSTAGGWNKMFAPGSIKEKAKPAGGKDLVPSYGGGVMAVAVSGPSADADLRAPVNVGSLDLATVDLSFKANEGDEKGTFPVSVALTRDVKGKQQRIVVSGDADFVSNGELTRQRSKYNEYYLHGLFRWFSNGLFPVDVTRPPARDMDIKISRGQITGLMWLCKGIIPAIIAIMGAIVLFKRRRN
ncbi:MAG: ABC transporter permease [Sphingobacteriales bacterium]|nr:MAG: ABC transporter permease [Sphingobacteriales bacterium]